MKCYLGGQRMEGYHVPTVRILQMNFSLSMKTNLVGLIVIDGSYQRIIHIGEVGMCSEKAKW